MKKVLVLLLTLVLLAVPVSANVDIVFDAEKLLTTEEAILLETQYADFAAAHDFTPILVTVSDFGGKSAEAFAGDYYDAHGFPEDGILLLVSLTEGQWYILTNGQCYYRISDWDAEMIGEAIVPLIRDGAYYEAFSQFPELAEEIYSAAGVSHYGGADAPVTVTRNYGKTIAICMGVGLLIGGITVGIMASMMKTVRPQNSAADYVRPGSMMLTNQRDIFLYSHVHRTPKPKNNSSGGHSGGSRGGAGGRI